MQLENEREKEVVIADSDPDIRELLAKILLDPKVRLQVNSSFRLNVLDSPSELPELLDNNGTSIGCVVLDVRLDPFKKTNQLNGIRFAKTLEKTINGHIRLVFITTEDVEEHPEMAELGQVVKQPFQNKEFISAVNRALDQNNGKN